MDSFNNIKVITAIAPISPAATGTITGTVLDTANFGSNTFVISAGAQTTTGITVTPVVLSGTVTSSLASAADSELLGTEAAAALSGTAGATKTTKIGYIGADRYVRVDLVVTAAATGVYSAVLHQGLPRKVPQGQS